MDKFGNLGFPSPKAFPNLNAYFHQSKISPLILSPAKQQQAINPLTMAMAHSIFWMIIRMIMVSPRPVPCCWPDLIQLMRLVTNTFAFICA